jgi:quercetin dioxygenase-like cupin family protein
MIVAALTLLLGADAAAAPIPARVPVASFVVSPGKAVTHVEAMRTEFLAGQTMPEHMHPVPVVCFVAKGSFVYSIGNDPVRTANVGEATIEPAGAIVHYFRNASATETGALNCMFLVGPDDKQLSVMLNK